MHMHPSQPHDGKTQHKQARDRLRCLIGTPNSAENTAATPAVRQTGYPELKSRQDRAVAPAERKVAESRRASNGKSFAHDV